MDLYCRRCGEPWDFDTLHEEVELRFVKEHGRPPTADSQENRGAYSLLFSEVSGEFRSIGCGALREFRGTDELCERHTSMRAVAAEAAYEVLGDDLDGAAAMLEDVS